MVVDGLDAADGSEFGGLGNGGSTSIVRTLEMLAPWPWLCPSPVPPVPPPSCPPGLVACANAWRAFIPPDPLESPAPGE